MEFLHFCFCCLILLFLLLLLLLMLILCECFHHMVLCHNPRKIQVKVDIREIRERTHKTRARERDMRNVWSVLPLHCVPRTLNSYVIWCAFRLVQRNKRKNAKSKLNLSTLFFSPVSNGSTSRLSCGLALRNSRRPTGKHDTLKIMAGVRVQHQQRTALTM